MSYLFWQTLSNRIIAAQLAFDYVLTQDMRNTPDWTLTHHLKPLLLPFLPELRQVDAMAISLPRESRAALGQTISLLEKLLTSNEDSGERLAKQAMGSLLVLRPAMDALIEFTVRATQVTERAFSHLQRSIIADVNVRKRWLTAFRNAREEGCEQLGATHLLLHGIWGFKANTEGERTDLVLGTPLRDIDEARRTSIALVLTEWKKVHKESELPKAIRTAKKQAKRYAESSLAGFELDMVRFLIMVSHERMEGFPRNLPPDNDGIVYRCVNVAVNPPSPSKEARSKTRARQQRPRSIQRKS